MNRLDGKVAFISGAARGIGAAAARLMVEEFDFTRQLTSLVSGLEHARGQSLC